MIFYFILDCVSFRMYQDVYNVMYLCNICDCQCNFYVFIKKKGLFVFFFFGIDLLQMSMVDIIVEGDIVNKNMICYVYK